MLLMSLQAQVGTRCQILMLCEGMLDWFHRRMLRRQRLCRTWREERVVEGGWYLMGLNFRGGDVLATHVTNRGDGLKG